MATTPILAIIDPKKPFVVDIDSSDKAIGEILIQEGIPIIFESEKLNKALFMKGNYIPLSLHLKSGVIICRASNSTLCLTK